MVPTTALSDFDADSIEYRGHDLTEDIMGQLDFGETVYLLLTGDQAGSGEGRIMNAMLTSLMTHGLTSQAMAARLTLLSAPESVQGAVASGVLGAGSRFLGAMEECSHYLGAVTTDGVEPATPEQLVATFLEGGRAFPGIGHPHHTPVDPRAEALFEIAAEEAIAGEHVNALQQVRSQFEAETEATLPINVTGAIGALTADMGLSPTAAKGIGIISRTAGIVADVDEEQKQPIAMDLFELAEAETTYATPTREAPGEGE